VAITSIGAPSVCLVNRTEYDCPVHGDTHAQPSPQMHNVLKNPCEISKCRSYGILEVIPPLFLRPFLSSSLICRRGLQQERVSVFWVGVCSLWSSLSTWTGLLGRWLMQEAGHFCLWKPPGQVLTTTLNANEVPGRTGSPPPPSPPPLLPSPLLPPPAPSPRAPLGICALLGFLSVIQGHRDVHNLLAW